MVTEALARGGAERQMLALTRGLLDRDYAVGVVELVSTVPGQADFIDEFSAHGIAPLRAIDFSRSEQDERPGPAVMSLYEYSEILPRPLERICAGLKTVMREFDPTVIYCWSDSANLIGGAVGTQKHVPRIILGQRTFPPPFWGGVAIADLYRQAYRSLLREPNMVMVNISTASADAYSKWLGTGQTIKVIRNGVDPTGMHDNWKGTEFRRQLGIGDAPVVGTVMRFAPEKDPVLWVRTAAIIGAARPDVHFILNGYGHGDVATQLRALSDELGLENRLHMPAAVTEVGSVYNALTAFLLTSRTDATPNALLEAQACGVPVIAPAIGGIGETMLDKVTGAVVRVRSAEALAAAVLAVLSDPLWQRRAKAWGPRFVADRFGVERMIDETTAIWE
ncbi:MAG: glycosyltransferase [Stellaceae bacterium]